VEKVIFRNSDTEIAFFEYIQTSKNKKGFLKLYALEKPLYMQVVSVLHLQHQCIWQDLMEVLGIIGIILLMILMSFMFLEKKKKLQVHLLQQEYQVHLRKER
jgi:hypothetical protein